MLFDFLILVKFKDHYAEMVLYPIEGSSFPSSFGTFSSDFFFLFSDVKFLFFLPLLTDSGSIPLGSGMMRG